MNPSAHTLWTLAVDVGGTFTDCIAVDPGGRRSRLKLLSHGALRSMGASQETDAEVKVEGSWPFDPNLLAGYRFRWLNSAETAEVAAWREDACSLVLSKQLPGVGEFELSTGEEAPILAARLLTATSFSEPLPPVCLKLGSTRGTNTLLERKGARVAYITNLGLGDLPLIGDQQRPALFAREIRLPVPLHATQFELSARLTAAGEELRPLTDAELAELLLRLRAAAPEALALAFLHSYLNPVHEQQVTAALRAAGYRFISASSDLAPDIKLLPRARTAIVDAYLSPALSDYLQQIGSHLPEGMLEVMASTGALSPVAFFKAKDSLLSGPAGGLEGAADIARRAGLSKVITLDMGGTSTDVARWDGQWSIQHETRVGDARIASPSMAIHTVAAGGGSICDADGQRLVVGPASAGARPGPACYGMGGPLCLTDVNLLLGRLDPHRFPIPITAAAAALRLHNLAQQAAMPPAEMLAGWLALANEFMAQAIRTISVRAGFDPAEYTLLAFGGAGAVHACEVADLLAIREVVAPYEAGLLSAAGIALAQPRHIEKTPAQVALSAEAQWLPLLNRATRLASAAIEARSGRRPEVVQRTLYLRLKGQDSSLELVEEPRDTLAERFEAAYRTVFGHWITGRAIEVEAVQAHAGMNPPAAPPSDTLFEGYAPEPLSHTAFGPVFDWEILRPGAYIAGPAVVAGPYGSAVVARGWVARVENDRLLRMRPGENYRPAPGAPEQAALSLFIHRFENIATEMGALLERTSFSVNIKERLDFSCALLDREARLVANAPHIPVHLGSLGFAVRAALAALPVGPGDVVLTNHPGFGGSHLPDLTMIAGVFDADGALLGYVANRAHHAEVGGIRPGSLPTGARNLAEEGVVIAPVYLVRKGEVQWQALENLFTQWPHPTRAWAENQADLLAGLAALHAGATALQKVCRAEGRTRVWHFMAELRAYARSRVQAALDRAELKAGNYVARMDDGSILSLRLYPENGIWTFDFAGTSPPHPGNLNANPAIVHSVVMYALRVLMDADVPLNEGILEGVKVVIPPSMLNPPFVADAAVCPAVVGGNVETSQQLADLLVQALGLMAAGQGTMNNLAFGNEAFGCYETLGGGAGAGPGFHGASAVQVHMTNTRITDPEVMERRFPVRVEEFSIRTGSGGAGAFRGGDGLVRQLRFLEPVSVSLLTQRRNAGAPGGQGGGAGAPGKQELIRADGLAVTLPAQADLQAAAGEAIRLETPGGGGWGQLDGSSAFKGIN